MCEQDDNLWKKGFKALDEAGYISGVRGIPKLLNWTPKPGDTVPLIASGIRGCNGIEWWM